MSSTDDTIIITFTDYKYLPIFNIFYKHFEKLNLNNLLVISLDKETFNELTSRTINTVLKEYNTGYSKDLLSKRYFFIDRLIVINEIFKSTKKNIIHTDADCFWFKNILTEINKIKNCDIIGQIDPGGLLPNRIVKKIEFELCCGFFYIKYNESNAKIIDNMLEIKDLVEKKYKRLCDQRLFNHYFIINKRKIINTTKNTFLRYKIILNDNTTIGMIRCKHSSRNYQSNLYCYHPFLGRGTIEDRIKLLKKCPEI
jgi:hypothetical protein